MNAIANFNILSIFNVNDQNVNPQTNIAPYSFLDKIKRQPSKIWGPHKTPKYVFHISERIQWMSNAKAYFPLDNDNVECCDEDLIHAYATRNLFYKEYVKKIQRGCSTGGGSVFGSFFGPLEKIKNYMNSAASPADYDSSRMDIIDINSHVLVAIEVGFFEGCDLFHWHDDEFAYPYVEGPMDKLSAAVEFRLRYDPVHSTVCLPSQRQIAHALQSLENTRNLAKY